MARKRIVLPILGIAVLAILVAANLIFRRPAGREVRSERVARHSIESWVRAPGTVEPLIAVEISSNVTGRVERLYVQEGDRVAKGTLLLTLDSTRFQSAVEQQAALLRAARAQLALAEAQHDQAEQVRTRREGVSEQGLISTEQLETAQVDARVQAARVVAQREEIERIEAALAEARRDVEETRFYAPMDGIVTSLNLEEGENVVIGTMNAPGTVILTLSDLAVMEVEARVSESDVVRVRAGQSTRVEVDAEPDSALVGTVSMIGESGDRISRDEGAEFEVRVTVTDPPAWLKPGMSADVAILVAQADSVTAIPIQALIARDEETTARWERGETGKRAPGRPGATPPGGDSEGIEFTRSEATRKTLIEGVFVVDQGRAQFRRVDTGVSGESLIEVLSGLAVGDEVITGPYRILRRLDQGEAVKVKSDAGDES
jgi:HlyD family secretion protein